MPNAALAAIKQSKTSYADTSNLSDLVQVFCNNKKTQTPTKGPAKDANTSIIKGFAAMTLTLHDISNRTLRLNWNALLNPIQTTQTETSLEISVISTIIQKLGTDTSFSQKRHIQACSHKFS